jgi:Invasin, domain 3
MKTSSLILLALFTLCSCKFSFDKAKVEESYGNYDGGAGGGGSTCPTNDPDPSYSTLSVDSTKLADGIEEATLTYTLLDCNSQPIIGFTPVFTATDSSSLNTQTACTSSDSSGVSTCKLKSEYAETKTITTTNIALAGATIEFTVPPLTLNLTACLAGDSLGMALPMTSNSSLSYVSPYIAYHPQFFTNSEIAQPIIPQNTAVDWVLVQLYANNATNANPSDATPIDAKSAIIHTDGSITDPSSSAGGDLTFNNGLDSDFNTEYRINIIHRNHLPVGFDDLVARSNPNIDMTLLATNYLGESLVDSEKPYVVKAGKKCLRAGDFYKAPFDNTIDATDESEIKNYLFVGPGSMFPGFPYQTTDLSIPGYLNSDITLNGYSFLWSSSSGTADEDLKAILDNQMTASTPLWGDGAP